MQPALPDEAKEAIRRIIDGYQPERIVLFGSYAYGRPDENSDVDLFVVKTTQDRPFDRLKRVRRLLRSMDRHVALDIVVYTPQELQDRIRRGDSFVNLVLNEGIVLHGA
ncbi:MAG: nucleotidyltransferase domain-containing protein [Thermoplasmatota archaeon]